MKHPNILLNVLYLMSDIYKIVRVILQGSYKGARQQFAQAMSQTSARRPEPQATTQVTPNLNIKVEKFGAIIAEFTKTMAKVLSEVVETQTIPTDKLTVTFVVVNTIYMIARLSMSMFRQENVGTTLMGKWSYRLVHMSLGKFLVPF